MLGIVLIRLEIVVWFRLVLLSSVGRLFMICGREGMVIFVFILS